METLLSPPPKPFSLEPEDVGGVDAMFSIPMPDTEVNGLVVTVKGPNTTYGKGQPISVYTDSDAPPDANTTVSALISTVTNTTPVRLDLATPHGAETGDNLRVTGTGIAAIDNKWWKVDIIDSDSLTLRGSLASGVAAVGLLYGNRSRLGFRIDDDMSPGTSGGFHVATGIRGNSGQVVAAAGVGYGIHIDPSNDVNGLIIDNPSVSKWLATPISPYVIVRDTRSTPWRDLWKVNPDGSVVMRPKAGRAANSKTFSVRNDADNADVFFIDLEGDVLGQSSTMAGNVVSQSALSTQVYIGSTFGVAGIAFGPNDSHIMRLDVGKLLISTMFDMPEASTPSNPAANRCRFFVRDNGSGKTQFGVIFPTGGAIILATEA